MSILAANPDPIFTPLVIICSLAALLFCGTLAYFLGVFHPRRVMGPDRLDADRPVFPLAVAMGMGFFTLLLVAQAYASWRRLGVASAPGGAPTQPGVLDNAFLFSVPTIAGVLVLMLSDGLIGGFSLFRRLGLTLSNIPAGLLKGLLASLVILPLTYLAVLLTEWFYRRIGFVHPPEHELLKMLTESGPHPLARWVLIASATLIAPFSEEFFFRAHLQTLFRRMLEVLSSPKRSQILFGFPPLPAGHPINPLPPITAPGVLPSAIPAEMAPAAPRRVWQTWVAIVLTSCIFAWVHPLWMRPAIFFLALGLGYCYERTGNLWTNFAVHCLFNTTSTFLFLSTAHT